MNKQYTKMAEKELARRFGVNDYDELKATISAQKELSQNPELYETYLEHLNIFVEGYADLLNYYGNGPRLIDHYNFANNKNLSNYQKAQEFLKDRHWDNTELPITNTLNSKAFIDDFFNELFVPNTDTNANNSFELYLPKENSFFEFDPNLDYQKTKACLLKEGKKWVSCIPTEAKEQFNTASSLNRTNPTDPLILDLDGDGIETTSTENGVFFDHQSDGFAETSAWVAQDDAILVHDKNANGIVDNGNEIFGDNYTKLDGSLASSGFNALADLDSNNDGIINALDSAFDSLKLLKGDGSLLTLSEAGIESISLTNSATNTTDDNGNTQTAIGSFTKSDQTTGAIADYILQNDKTNSIATEWIDVSEDVEILPNISGSGTNYSLQQAMMRNSELKTLVQSFVNATDIDLKRQLVNPILYKWCDVENISPTSRGENVNAQQLAVLEKFMGTNFVGTGNATNPNNNAGPMLTQAYLVLANYIYAELESQSSLSSIYDLLEMNYNAETQKYTFDLSAVKSHLDNLLTTDYNTAIKTLEDFTKTFNALGLVQDSNYSTFEAYFSEISDELAQIMQEANKSMIFGSSEIDNISASELPEVAYGFGGNDRILTRQGDDIIYGGDGDDYLNSCEGNDVIYGENGDDTIWAGKGNDIVYGGAGADEIQYSAGDDIIYGGDGNDTIELADGTQIAYGEAGNDTIKAYRNGNHTFVGGVGDDHLETTIGGDDTYIFNLGDGHDTIIDINGEDVIRFGEGITQDNIQFSGSGNSLIITFGNQNDSIEIQGLIGLERRYIESFEFSDGTSMTIEQALSSMALKGTENADTLKGTSADELIMAYGGDDTIKYSLGNDIIFAGDGNDTIQLADGNQIAYGEAGNDTIKAYRNGNHTFVGGAGNDHLETTISGNDTYIFNAGDGADIVIDSGGTDVIKFGEDVALEDIAFYLGRYSKLYVDYGATAGNDVIEISSQTTTNRRIESFEAFDAQGNTKTISSTQIDSILQYIATFNENNPDAQIDSAQAVRANEEIMTLIANSWTDVA